VKAVGFLSFGHWRPSPASQTRSASDALLQSIDLAVAAADQIAGGRLQLGISRGSPEQVVDGFRYLGYEPPEGTTDADMARARSETFLRVIEGAAFAQPSPRPMFPNPPGLLRLEPYSPGLRDRIWWGAGSNATAGWAAHAAGAPRLRQPQRLRPGRRA